MPVPSCSRRSIGRRGSTGLGRVPAGTCRPCPHVPTDFGSHAAERHQAAARTRPRSRRRCTRRHWNAAAPPSALVDETQQIVHLSPSAGRFILHSAGTFSGKLPDVVRPELRLDLKIALDHALEKRLPSLTLAAPVAFDGGLRRIAMQVSPVPGEGNAAMQALVVFLDGGPVAEDDEPEIDPASAGADDMRRLHGELRAAQEALVASRGEHETAIEDLRAANEELQSINEEYRSTSEELETSKEELQSMNEELQTVNAELKNKLRASPRRTAIFRTSSRRPRSARSSSITKLRIRMFTPPMSAALQHHRDGRRPGDHRLHQPADL